MIWDIVYESRKTPGCISFDLVKNTDAQYGLINVWRSAEDEAEYKAAPLKLDVLARAAQGKLGLDRSQGTNGFSKTLYTSWSH